ncbi:MAG: hypothetical protein QOH65_1556 [Methylobacteriaceae bacterium]|nr:hypothetical protein [Methylobacteriaceae bacterium]
MSPLGKDLKNVSFAAMHDVGRIQEAKRAVISAKRRAFRALKNEI